jgi:hypothetical protein
MVKSISLFLVVASLVAGCSNNAQVEYKYPKNEADRDSDKVGSFVPGGGIYIIKPQVIEK